MTPRELGQGEPNLLNQLQLEVLVSEYEQARDDERHLLSQQGQGLALSLTVISLMAVVAFPRVIGPDVLQLDSDLVRAAAPFPALAILFFVQSAGSMAVLRSFYLRALEREIRRRLALGDNDLIDPGSSANASSLALSSMSWSEFSAAKQNLARAPRYSRFYQAMVGFIVASAWVIFGGLLAILIHDTTIIAVKYLMLLFYGAGAIGAMTEFVRVNRDGRETFEHYAVLVQERRGEGLSSTKSGEEKTGRSIASYLVLPRPDDLAKSLYLIAGMGFGIISARLWGSLDGSDWWTLVIAYVLIELLFYQARYQWNDLRGRFEDATAPQAVDRGRLPAGSEHASALVILVRFYLAAALLSLFQDGQVLSPSTVPQLAGEGGWWDGWSLSLTFASTIFGTAIIYEIFRSRLARRGQCSDLELAALLIFVSIGYPLRFLYGWLATGADLTQSTAMIAAAFFGVGLATVSLPWILEGLSAAQFFAGQAEDRPQFGDEKWRKPHLRRLLRWAGVPVEQGRDETLIPPPADRNGGTIGTVPGTVGKHWAPHHLGLAMGCAFLVFAYADLPAVPAFLLGSSVTALIAVASRLSPPSAIPMTLLVGSLAVATAGIGGGILGLGTGVFVSVGLAAAVVPLTVHGLLTGTYEASRSYFKKIGHRVLEAAKVAYLFVIGNERHPSAATSE